MAGQSSDGVGVARVRRGVRRFVVFLFAVSSLSTSAGRSWAVAGASTVKCGRQPAWAENNTLQACSCAPERITSRPCSRQWLNAAGAGSEIVIDHGNSPWIPGDQEQIFGVHCNVSSFYLPAGRTVFIKAWDGSNGGRLILEVHGNVTVAGTLDGEGRGYRGGPLSRAGRGYAGESKGSGQFVQQAAATSGGARTGGGGGGLSLVKSSANSFLTVGRPGAGASYGSTGTVGTATGVHDFSSAGVLYGDSCLSSLYPGSGGGGGAASSSAVFNPHGGAGGNGGASIFVYSVTGHISVPTGGSLRMDGKNGFGDPGTTCGACPQTCNATGLFGSQCSSQSNLSCFDFAGPGGGGSGGAVHLSAGRVDIQGKVSAVGGIGGIGVFSLTGCGGNAGVGRVRIDANGIVGTTTPAAANNDIFSYCPCNATGTTIPTAGPVTTTETITSTSVGIVLSATSSSGTGQTQASVTPAATGTNAAPAATTSEATSATVRSAATGSSRMEVWAIIVIVLAALLLISAMIVTVYCAMKKRRKSPKFIVEEPAAYDNAGPMYARFNRTDSGGTCAQCGGVRPRCYCQQPPGITNATYSDQQIAFSIPTPSAASPVAKVSVSAIPEYSNPEDLDTVSNGVLARQCSQRNNGNGAQNHNAQNQASGSRDTRPHTYDEVEGGPGAANTKNAFRNPNYGLRIPVAQQQDPASNGNGAVLGKATSPMSPGNSSYANIMPDSNDLTPGDQKIRLTSFGSERDIPTDASGYLVAYNRSPSSNNGNFPTAQGSREARNSMHSVSSKATVMSTVTVSPEEEQPRVFFQFPDSGAGAGAGVGAKHHQVTDARTAPHHGGPLHSCVSPLTPSSAAGQPGREPDPMRKDSGIEVDASCYAVVPIDVLPNGGNHGMSSQAGSGLEVRRPGSTEPMQKLMSPIPEQLPPAAAAGFLARETNASAHQYAHVSDIAPPLSPGIGKPCSQDEKSPTFSVSAV